jgi:hypothetical protein
MAPLYCVFGDTLEVLQKELLQTLQLLLQSWWAIHLLNVCQVLSLCLTKYLAMKTWGSGGIVPCILILALDGSEWSASLPDHFTPRERAPITNWIGGWMGPRASLDKVVKRKESLPLPGIKLWSIIP